MSNYKLLTGPFAGSVVEEGQILDVAFSTLDDDLQFRIKDWAEQRLGDKYIEVDDGCNFAYKGESDTPISMNQIKEDYESSWDSEKTEEKANLRPVSEW